jgi:hypothetical protein
MLWRDSTSAWKSVRILASKKQFRTEFYEKDYWVTQALRTLAREFPNDFVFKGGTSLSKAFHCIQRFSEDADILVLQNGRTKGEIDRLMRQMAERVMSESGLTRNSVASESGRGTHRNEMLRYSPFSKVDEVLLDSSIRLEMGIRGSDVPTHLMRPIRPLVAEHLLAEGDNISEFDDLAQFDVSVLHPGRTLVEKLILLHQYFTPSAGPQSQKSKSQIGRHFHDVHRLIEMSVIREWLANREEFFAAIADHEEICRTHFKQWVPPRPALGYAQSQAFTGSSQGDMLPTEAYEAAMRELGFGANGHPPWSEVLATVKQHSSLL